MSLPKGLGGNMHLAAGEAADGDDHLNSFVLYRLGIPQIGQGVPFLSHWEGKLCL